MKHQPRTFSSRLAFELSLLQLMAEDVRASTLQRIGLNESDVLWSKSAVTLRLPEQASSSIHEYVALLGREAVVYRLPDHEIGPFAPSDAHCFSLILWPHLYWVVNRDSDGRSWGVGFRHQARVALPEFEPELVQPVLWTRDALHALMDSFVIIDGWEESVVERFRFGSRVYEGEFVFGLLQRWTRVD